jgi:hypothetical protein
MSACPAQPGAFSRTQPAGQTPACNDKNQCPTAH